MQRKIAALILILLVFVKHLYADSVQAPQLIKQIDWLETTWFASPIIYDLDADGQNELIGTYYSIFVWDKNFNLLDKMPYQNYHKGRIYAPAVVADLEGDGVTEIVVGGSKGRVAAYEWKNKKLSIKSGWPVITYDGKGMDPEVRSLAAADLNHDGHIEIIAANTQTDDDEPQVYVISPNGKLYQPQGISWAAWPRYNLATGTGNDGDSNGQGNDGYGCFGENIGVGNLDDDPELEIVVTFDDHQVNVFNHDGTSHLASDYFKNRSSQYKGNRLNWGQFIRWYDPLVEFNHYNQHTGDWPHPSKQKWCQWTSSPTNVIDLNGDGKNEVVGVPNIEMDVPYDTKHHSVMVLEGSYGDGSRSARRLSGWEALPGSGYPQSRAGHSWYPPSGIPAPTTLDVLGDPNPEIIVPLNDGYIYMFSSTANRLWRYDYTHGRDLMYASEVLVADLNQDGVGELVFTTYGDPENIKPGIAHGYLVILDVGGNVLYDLELPVQGTNGNGKGAPAAPTLGDLDGDGDLEIIVQTFGGKCFVYSVPGSATNYMPWPTGRGTYLRQGRGIATASDGELSISKANLVVFWKKKKKDHLIIKGSFPASTKPFEQTALFSASYGDVVVLEDVKASVKKNTALAKQGKKKKIKVIWNAKKKRASFTFSQKAANLRDNFGLSKSNKSGKMSLDFSLELGSQAYTASINMKYKRKKSKGRKKSLRTVGWKLK